jgi:hypothetical protein
VVDRVSSGLQWTSWLRESARIISMTARRRNAIAFVLLRQFLGYGNFLREVYILNCVQQFHAFIHRPLESFAPGD